MTATAELTEERVMETLRGVRFPGLSRDIVSFGFVKDVSVGGGNVSLRLEIMTDSPKAAEEIRRDATERLRALPGVNAVTIRLDTRPPAATAPRPAGAPGMAPPAAAEILPNVRWKIAVASGKGGVGKSTVAANLALALERVGRRVGLMDSDIYGPSQQMMMGIDQKPFVNEANQIVPIERHGVKVMSLGFLMDVDQPVIWRGPMVMKAVEQFLQDVAWGTLDFLVIDLPPGTGDAQLTISQKVRLAGTSSSCQVMGPPSAAGPRRAPPASDGLNSPMRRNCPALPHSEGTDEICGGTPWRSAGPGRRPNNRWTCDGAARSSETPTRPRRPG